MDFNTELAIVSTSPMTEKEVYSAVTSFIQDNEDLDGIYRIQIDEFLRFLRRKLDVAENGSTAGLVEVGMRELQ